MSGKDGRHYRACQLQALYKKKKKTISQALLSYVVETNKTLFLSYFNGFINIQSFAIQARIQITRTLTINFKIPNSIFITKTSPVKRIGVHHIN